MTDANKPHRPSSLTAEQVASLRAYAWSLPPLTQDEQEALAAVVSEVLIEARLARATRV